MSGGKSGAKSASSSKSQTRSAKAGLQFPVGHIHLSFVVAATPSVYVLVLPYTLLLFLSSSLLKFSNWLVIPAVTKNKVSYHSHHLQFAIGNVEELNKLLDHVTIAQGSVLPNIHAKPFPKKTKKIGAS
jgi:histone H2A